MNIKEILKSIGNFLTGAAVKVKAILSHGVKVANVIKNVADSPLMDVAVGLTTTNIDNEVLRYLRIKLPVWITTMGWAEKTINDFDETTLPHVLNSISAEVAKLEADFKDIDLSRQQAIASMQVVYDPKIVVA